MNQPTVKLCSMCKTEKSASEFHKNKELKSGLRSACKQCCKKYTANQEIKRKTPEGRAKKRAWSRTRTASDRMRERARRHSVKRIQQYPEKEAARNAVRCALRRGDMVRPEACEVCNAIPLKGKDGRSYIHGHHDDYSKPLEVRWLCTECHAKYHFALADEMERTGRSGDANRVREIVNG